MCHPLLNSLMRALVRNAALIAAILMPAAGAKAHGTPPSATAYRSDGADR
jgi:hypothetical protein